MSDFKYTKEKRTKGQEEILASIPVATTATPAGQPSPLNSLPPAETEKEFKIVALSKNRNSFGMTGACIIGRDGEAFEIGVYNELEPKFKVGDIIKLRVTESKRRDTARYVWQDLNTMRSFELPRMLPPPPVEVTKTVWSVPEKSRIIVPPGHGRKP